MFFGGGFGDECRRAFLIFFWGVGEGVWGKMGRAEI